MKDSRSHISIVCVAVWLLTGILFGTMHGLAQTPAGMHIYNEAKGTFRYKSGVSDSLRSNMTETVVRSAHYVASSLQLTVGRVAIEGSGQDSVVAIATVLDSTGHPVPDGTRVTFFSTAGSLHARQDSVLISTVDGIAAVGLVSEVVTHMIVTARLSATTMGVRNQLLTSAASVIFFPGAILGSVVSTNNGQPLIGALVVAYDQAKSEESRDTTNTNGCYLLPLATSGAHTQVFTYQNRFGDVVQATFNLFMAIPVQGAIPAAPANNAVAGNVVDRISGNPIHQAGIQVTLASASPSKSNGGRPLPVFQTTDAHGAFVFDSLSPGTFSISVNDEKYSGTITVTDTAQGCFMVNAIVGVSDRTSLEVVKSANKRIVEIGDAVTYSLDIKNMSAVTSLANIIVVDELPVGFAYVHQTSRHNQMSFANPLGSRHLEWRLPDTLAPGSTTHLTYAASIGAGALDGDGVNHAFAAGTSFAGDSVRSSTASVAVVVRPGVFTDHGIVIGKVFVDANGDGVQQQQDHGIAGVELWMEDGTHIVTGDDGKYSVPDVRPGQHVMRVDQRTLPAGSTVLAIGTESAGDGVSRFVRLVDGGVARADFHILPPNQAAMTMYAWPAPPRGQLRMMLVIKWQDVGKPSAITLVDTLPHGLAYQVRVAPHNGTVGSPLSTPSRYLTVLFQNGLKGSSDTLTADIVQDSMTATKCVTLHPRLVFSYPRRRDAVIAIERKVAVPVGVAPRGISSSPATSNKGTETGGRPTPESNRSLGATADVKRSSK